MITLAMLIGLFVPAPKEREPFAGKPQSQSKIDLRKLQGEWIVVSLEAKGKDFTEEFSKAKVVIEKDKMTMGSGKDAMMADFSLDATTKPKQIDFNGVVKVQGIYELDGDTLKICFAAAGKPRPTEFTTKADRDHGMFAFKRK